MSRPELLYIRSPGRVNLIGEHTDYQDGFVLPAAIDLGTSVSVKRRDDDLLRLTAARLRETHTIPLAELDDATGPEWTQYVRGCAIMLRSAGCDLPGADLFIDSSLPIGAGLSSSASLEVGVALALATVAGFTIDPVSLARLCQRAENEVVGVRCGIMDQLAVACGMADHALLIDCRTAQSSPVPIPPSVRVLIFDSAVPRNLASTAYNQRRIEAASAVRAIQSVAPRVLALRDVTPELFAAVAGRLDDVQRRRARHIVSENERVLRSASALASGDAVTFGRLMVDSHASLRDDYQVSVPDLDTLVDIALTTPGVLGARMTGAGFGGCAVALVAAEHADEAGKSILARYGELSGRVGAGWVCRASDGAHVLASR